MPKRVAISRGGHALGSVPFNYSDRCRTWAAVPASRSGARWRSPSHGASITRSRGPSCTAFSVGSTCSISRSRGTDRADTRGKKSRRRSAVRSRSGDMTSRTKTVSRFAPRSRCWNARLRSRTGSRSRHRSRFGTLRAGAATSRVCPSREPSATPTFVVGSWRRACTRLRR